MTNLELVELLGATSGVVCCVGAGGKKSTLYRLAGAHRGRVGITATAHIEHFPQALHAASVVATGAALLAGVAARSERHRVVAFAKPCSLPGRHLGVDFDELAALQAAGGFGLLLVKADGARSRILKAPAAHEPALPPKVETVIPVCSIHALGELLSERIAHRPEQVAVITGLQLGEILRPAHLARLLSSPDGALRGVGSARVIPLINMVDDLALERQAVQVAEAALAATSRYDYIVLASLRHPTNPVVRVVHR
ncbi:MAG: putative selenium-dependent hydroxylase accessory protein YqeC [Gammaproteobacteria bacterium]|nr:putative selenium-dependent hydroxylase accessory protein YqeC [Gammaproteobacteria bacterium]